MLSAMKSSVVLLPPDPFVPLTQAQIKESYWGEWEEIIEQLPKCDPMQGPWIAGGAVRRLLLGGDFCAKDIDYFCADKQQFSLTCARLEMLDGCLMQETKDHHTYQIILEGDIKLKVQVVKTRFRPNLFAHLNEFDFTICQTGWDGISFFVSLPAYRDLQAKTLKLTGPLHSPLGSWMRLVKYAQQGFAAPQETLQTLLMLAAQEDLDPEEGY